MRRYFLFSIAPHITENKKMRLVIKREKTTPAGNVPGRLFMDGQFFAYTMENAAKMIPAGTFPIYWRFSPKLLANKIAIDVPGRQYIMFHGGNVATKDSEGCVLTAARKLSGDYIQGDASTELYNTVRPAMDAGEAVTVTVKNPTNWPLVFAVAAASYFIITR